MIKNILIVDDVTMNRKIIKGILSKLVNNINIIEAEDGFKALDIIYQQDISVVILDIMMPGKDGIEVLSELKANPKTKNLPVIMCSAIHETNSVEKALNLGALDYFTKPLSEEQMRITLPLKVKNALEYYENKKELLKFYDHFKEEMQFAEQIQKALVSEYVDLNNAEMWSRYIPCEEIGGDIFCVKQVEDKFWFMIADISGHGISAALISTMINVIFNLSVEFCSTPDEILKRINKTLFEVFNDSKYGLISAFAGYISDKSLCYVNAGQPYPVLCRKSGDIETLDARGFLLGIFEDCEFSSACKTIESGDAILLYTDGLFDKGSNKGFAKWDLVKDYCEKNKLELVLNSNTFLDDIVQEFSALGGNDFIDDVAVMIIRKK